QAADRLFTKKIYRQSPKVKSNHRLKNLCAALQRERNTAKIRELKRTLRHEFYYGDQAPATPPPRWMERPAPAVPNAGA
ncbi:MAG TPA: hypothetical protein VN829_15070, partial [Dongiaceae bacterium]|nr:hypothetical protein [Dongiaceae bacterium]